MVNAESRWFVYLQTEIEQRTLSCFTIENSLNVSLNSLLSCVNLCQGTVQTNRTSALRKPFFFLQFYHFWYRIDIWTQCNFFVGKMHTQSIRIQFNAWYATFKEVSLEQNSIELDPFWYSHVQSNRYYKH